MNTLKLSDAKEMIGFGQNDKVLKLKDKEFPIFDTSIFDKFFTGQDTYSIVDIDLDRKVSSSDLVRTGLVSYIAPSSVGIGFNLQLNKDCFNIVPSDNQVWSTKVQKQLNIHHIEVLETTPEEYDGIVPPEVNVAYVENKHMFDEVVVLYPKEEIQTFDFERVQTYLVSVEDNRREGERRMEEYRQKLVDDPFLCGKIKSMPGKYFLISYRLDDISPIQFFKENMQKMLIQENQLLLQHIS